MKIEVRIKRPLKSQTRPTTVMSQVAIVTGASSGIGLALTEHLSKGWRVILADIQPPLKTDNLTSDNSLYIKCDVSSWESQAAMFSQAFSWASRLDLVALNAGIDDKDDIFNTLDPINPPVKPNMATFDVDLLAVYWGVKLAAHYINRAGNGGHIVITASGAALYPHHAIPQYSAAKAGCVGLVRSLAPVAIKKDVGIHALCPAMVPTNLAPPGLMEGYIKGGGVITPMTTILRAYDAMIEPDQNGKRKSGKVVLASGENLTMMDEEWAQSRPGQARVEEELGDTSVWERIYYPRNAKFAREWEEKMRAQS